MYQGWVLEQFKIFWRGTSKRDVEGGNKENPVRFKENL